MCDASSKLFWSARQVLLAKWYCLTLFDFVQMLMVEPVIAADGHTYEKTAMQEWLRQHIISPATGVDLEHACLLPDFAVRSIIADLAHNREL